ncbi:hypothetical protein EP10_002774 [Geobacillus icigianus]|uniref:Uncharacterized protein n=1 Tax=Geobacillus icigianus TaxID=1430331 RepID=A0ABU6BIV4_9BACL|nr:hypothetical protein [Geobacillus icigianus]
MLYEITVSLMKESAQGFGVFFPRCGIVRIYGGALAVLALTKEVGLPHIRLALHSHAAGQMEWTVPQRFVKPVLHSLHMRRRCPIQSLLESSHGGWTHVRQQNGSFLRGARCTATALSLGSASSS